MRSGGLQRVYIACVRVVYLRCMLYFMRYGVRHIAYSVCIRCMQDQLYALTEDVCVTLGVTVFDT